MRIRQLLATLLSWVFEDRFHQLRGKIHCSLVVYLQPGSRPPQFPSAVHLL